MKKIALLFMISAMAALLAACVSSSGKTTYTNRITQEKLASGKITKIGYKAPQSAWQCKRIAQNWVI